MRVRKILAAVALVLPLVVVAGAEPAAADTVCEFFGRVYIDGGPVLGGGGTYEFGTMNIVCAGGMVETGAVESAGVSDSAGNFTGDFSTSFGCNGTIAFSTRGPVGFGTISTNCGSQLNVPYSVYLQLVPIAFSTSPIVYVTELFVTGTWVCWTGSRC